MAEHAFPYPAADITVAPLGEAFSSAFPSSARRVISREWPPPQTEYLRVYLKEMGCQTVVVEHHYVDRVFMHDNAIFYARNLRSYPNFTKRMHFFKGAFGQQDWKTLIAKAGAGERGTVQANLQEQYLGFSVVRPLPDSPVGRTLLPAYPSRAPADTKSLFPVLRRHRAHLAGFDLVVEGVPFQQQDQGVSACATTALWSSLDSVSAIEETSGISPASITEAATRYPLQEGRPFPSEGLTVRQLCEATRAAGFSPIVIRGTNLMNDRLQLLSYLDSSLSPVLALISTKDGATGHAVAAVGYRAGDLPPRTDPSLSFQDWSNCLRGVYIHDDRLGPYAFAELSPLTDSRSGVVRTRVAIEWPDKTPDVDWFLYAMVIPVPLKLRLTATRMRHVGLFAAETLGVALKEPRTTLHCRYEPARRYTSRCYEFGLSSDGLYALTCQTALSRLVGIAEIAGPDGPLMDLLLDTTEASAEPAVIACVKRGALRDVGLLRSFADYFGAASIA